MVAGKLVAKGIDFVTLVVLTRLLAPSDFGLVAMGMTLVLMLDSVLELPVAQALLRLKDPPSTAYDTAFTLSLLRGCVIAALVAALGRPLAAFYDEPRVVMLVLALAVGPVLRGLLSPRLVDLQRQLDFRWNAGLEVIGKVFALLTSAALAYTTRSYWALALANTVTPSVMTLVSYVVAPYRPRLRLSEWPEFADMLGWNSLSQLITAFNWQLDKFLLGRWTDAVSLGRFFMAENIASIPNNAIVGPISRPLMAAYAPLQTQQELKQAYCKASAAITLFGALPLVVMALLAKPLVRIAFDAEWLPAATPLLMLALSNVLVLPTEPLAGLAMALNRTRVLTWRSGFNLAVRLPTTLIGVYYYGVTGAVVARLFSNASVMLFAMVLLTRMIGASMREQWQALARPTAALAALAACLWVLEPWLQQVPKGVGLVMATGLVAAIATLAYVAVAAFAWNRAGRPHGAETIVMSRVNQYRQKLRRS